MLLLCQRQLDLSPLFLGKRQNGRGNIFFEMIDGGGPGNRQHDRRSMEQPGHRELGDCCVVLLSYLIQRTARVCEVTGSDREPRYEPDIVRFSVVKLVFVLSIGHVMTVLY